MDTNKNYFTTDIFLLACALLSLNFKFDSFQKIEGKFFFYFERTSGLDEVVAMFWARKLLIEVHSFDQSKRYFKTLIEHNK